MEGLNKHANVRIANNDLDTPLNRAAQWRIYDSWCQGNFLYGNKKPSRPDDIALYLNREKL